MACSDTCEPGCSNCAAKRAEAETRRLLLAADELINGERAKMYGDASESFAQAARAYCAISGQGEHDFTAQDVAKVLICLKLVRDSYTPGNRDHLLDAAGYLGLLDKIRRAP